jgi:hypothetical protein
VLLVDASQVVLGVPTMVCEGIKTGAWSPEVVGPRSHPLVATSFADIDVLLLPVECRYRLEEKCCSIGTSLTLVESVRELFGIRQKLWVVCGPLKHSCRESISVWCYCGQNQQSERKMHIANMKKLSEMTINNRRIKLDLKTSAPTPTPIT